MSLAKDAIEIGNFLLQSYDIIDDIRGAINRGIDKDDIRKAIQALQTKVSDDSLKEELQAAEQRKKDYGF